MNFFERQHQVRKLSRRLVLLFALAVLAIVTVVDVAAVVAFSLYELPAAQLVAVLITISLVVVLLIGACSFVRMLLLRSGGGGKVAQQLGGQYVPEDTTDPRLRRLRNVVEEMAIASGVPVPQVYVLDHEPGINAFAAGWSTGDAAIAVTRGCLEQLNRDELQGVIAHEFSHVVNGDMRLNIRLMGILFGILALAVVGRFMLFSGGRGSRKGGAAPIILIALAALIAGYVGVFFGRLIKAAVSRQREYLADASAVQFTRQTEGLTGALKKIGGLPTGSKLASGKVEDVSHMLFGDGLRLSSWFATHPPLPERIKVLDPTFDPQQLEALSRQWAQAPPNGMAEDHALGLTPARELPPTAPPARPAPAAAAPDTVVPLVFGLLLAAHPEARAQQHRVLTARHGKPLADAAWTDADALAQLRPELKLPLAEVAFSALRRRPQPELDQIVATVYELIKADGRTTVFEYCLSRLLHRELYEINHRGAPWGDKRHRLDDGAGRDAVATLLSTLARVGNSDPAQAQAAYQAGVARALSGQPPAYLPPPQGVVGLEPVWPVLDGLGDAGKQRLVEATVTVISHDGVMTVEEVEMLRTVCGVLHVPLPPFTETAVTSS